MKTTALISSIAALALLTACGGGSDTETAAAPESAEANGAPPPVGEVRSNNFVEVYMTHMNRMADAISQVDDDASAERAAEVIRAASADLAEWEPRVEGMSNAEKMAMARELQGEIMDPMGRMMTGMMQLAFSNPEAMEKISEALEGMPEFDDMPEMEMN